MKSTAFSKFAIVALAMVALMPSVASAATDAFTVYAYGNGNVLRQIFVGMKGFVNDPQYRMMLYTLLLITMIYVMTKGYIFMKPSPGPIVGLILAAFILNIALFSDSARVTLHIEDQVHSEDYLVDDMPLALAGAAALTSEMSRYLVKLVEGFYMGPSIPIEMRMSENNTYNFANKIISAMRNVTISDPMTKATFNAYMRDCVVPEMYQGRIQMNTLLNGPPDQFWDSIRANNQARMSQCFQHCGTQLPGEVCAPRECPDPYSSLGGGSPITAREWREGMMVSCPNGHTSLGERIETLIGATAFNELGNTMLRDSALLDGVISSTVTQITGVTGGTGTEHFVRAGMMNMFRESSASVIANGGAPGLIQVLGAEQAKAVQRTNWMVAAEVFSESVAYLWATLQSFIFAIFPIAVVLFMFPGLGPKAMAGYFGLLAWISLWMPFLAVINFLSISWLVEDVRQLAMTPLSYGSLLPISEAGANMQLITNFLGTMVPVLTYGMVRGGEFALTQIASDASAPKASEKASAEIAGKSYNYGSISANNVGMNKTDTTTSASLGYDTVTSKDGEGVATSLTPRTVATTTAAGSPDVVTSSVGTRGETSKTGALALSAGETKSYDFSTASAASATAEILANSSIGSEDSKSVLRQKGAEARDAAQDQKTQAATFGQAVEAFTGAEFGSDIRASTATSGGLVAGAVAGRLAAEQFGDFRREDGKGSAQTLKELGLKGRAAEDDKEADKFIDQARADAKAVKELLPEASPEEVGRVVTALRLARDLDKSDLDKMSKSPEERDMWSKLKGVLQDGGAVVGGGIAASGATIATVATNLPVMKDLIGPLLKTNTTLSTNNNTSTKTGTGSRDTTGLQTTDQVGTSRVLSLSDGYIESSSRANKAAEGVQATVRNMAQNTVGASFKEGKDGRLTVTATENTSAADSASITANRSAGFGNVIAQGSELQNKQLRGLDNVDGLIRGAQGAFEGVKADAQAGFDGVSARTAGAGRGAPAPVAVPTLQGNAQDQARKAVAGEGVQAPNPVAAPTSGEKPFTSEEYDKLVTTGQKRQQGDFGAATAPQQQVLEGIRDDAQAFAGAATLGAGKSLKVDDALNAGNARGQVEKEKVKEPLADR